MATLVVALQPRDKEELFFALKYYSKCAKIFSAIVAKVFVVNTKKKMNKEGSSENIK